MEDKPRTRPVRWLVLAALVIAAGVIGVVIGVAVADDDEDEASTTPTEQLASIQQACERWRGDDGAEDHPGCDDMVAWMADHMDDDGMSPSMMWGDADRVRDTCERWMDDDPPGDSIDPEEWCDGMADWMDDHSDDWMDDHMEDDGDDHMDDDGDDDGDG